LLFSHLTALKESYRIFDIIVVVFQLVIGNDLFNQLHSMKSSVFQDITLGTPLKVNWHFEGTCCKESLLAACFMLSCLAYFSALKIESTYSSKLLLDIWWTMWCYIPEDRTLHNLHCENLKSYKLYSTLSLLLLLCYCHITNHQVADGKMSGTYWRVTPNILNKQSQISNRKVVDNPA
jgi:hypothetical protein